MWRQVVPVILVALAACGRGTSQPPEESADTTATAVPTVAGERFDLQEHDLPLAVTLPDAQTAQADSVRILWNEDRGWLEVGRGAHFDMRISEQPCDLMRLKADLDRDALHKNTIVLEEPDMIIYRQEFPADVSLVCAHFVRSVRVGEREFCVESAADGRFNEADVRLMAGAVTPSRPD